MHYCNDVQKWIMLFNSFTLNRGRILLLFFLSMSMEVEKLHCLDTLENPGNNLIGQDKVVSY